MELSQTFSDRWRSQFPGTPPPDLLAELKFDCNVKSRSSADVQDSIKRAVEDSERKISSLRCQLEKELFIKELLENYANELSKRNESDAKLIENCDGRLRPRPVSVGSTTPNRPNSSVTSVTENDTGFEQFKAELTDTCSSEGNNVFAKHRSSLKHVEKKNSEWCTSHYEKVWINEQLSGGDNSSSLKHLTKVNCFKTDKSIFQMTSDSDKENSLETDASKGYGQVLVIPSSASEPNLAQNSSNSYIKIMDSDGLKDNVRTIHAPSRQGPVVPKKPPKPLPHPRRKISPMCSLPTTKSESEILSVKSQTFPKINPASQVASQVSFKANEASQSSVSDVATCANIKSGCGLDSSARDSKHRDDSLQCDSHVNERPTRDGVLDTLVKGVNSSAVIDIVSNVRDGQSTTPSTPAESKSNMRKFHRHKSEKKQNNTCDEMQGTYRKLSSEFDSCEVALDDLEKGKPHGKPSDTDTSAKINESVLGTSKDCVDGSSSLGGLSTHDNEQMYVDNQQNKIRSSLLDIVSFFKDSENEGELGAKNGNSSDRDEAPVMTKHSVHNGEEKFLDGDFVDGEFESLNASNEEPFAKKHSRLPSYENWTIDRCVTLPRFDDSNESEASDDIYDNINFQYSPPSTLHKYYSYKGSKDSGLCDDLSTPESHAGVESVPAEGTNLPARHDAVHNPPSMILIDNLDDSTDSDGSDSNKNSDGGCKYNNIYF